MNRAYYQKLSLYLLLIGLILTLFSCSLDITKDTSILRDLEKTVFESMLKDKHWGNNKQGCASSDICVHFRADNGNSGEITLKTSINGQHVPVGTWSYTADLATQGTFIAKNSAQITVGYFTEHNPLRLSVQVDFRGQALHKL